MDRLTHPVGARCQCGSKVSKRVAAILGDRDDVVPACPECWTNAHGQEFTSTVQAILSYRRHSRGE